MKINDHFVQALRRFRLIGLAVFALTACAEMREAPSREQEYRAYGRTWRYSTIERYTKDWGFGSTHGMFGIREKLEQFVYLTTEDGQKLPVHEHIYALQKDGSYKKVECCSKVLTQAAVYNFDQRLILYFEQTRAKTTDCVVHPENQPQQLDSDPEKGPHVSLFGEFDPKSSVFYVRDFLPGFSRDEFRDKVGARGSIEQTHRFFYENRRPFICK